MAGQKPYFPDIPRERKYEILELLEKKEIDIVPCSACKQMNPAVLEGLEVFEMNSLDTLIIRREPGVVGNFPSGRAWRAVAIICKMCGYRLEFDLDYLEKPQPA